MGHGASGAVSLGTALRGLTVGAPATLQPVAPAIATELPLNPYASSSGGGALEVIFPQNALQLIVCAS